MPTIEDLVQSILTQLKDLNERIPALTEERRSMVAQTLAPIDSELDSLIEALTELDEQ